jgi:hypothetical protein
MALTDSRKLDKSFKTLINKEFGSTAKASYEEFGANTINVNSSEVWGDSISSTPATAVSAGVARVLTTFTLSPVEGYTTSIFHVVSGSAFTPGTTINRATVDTTLLQRNFISDKYGVDYKARLFDNSGNEIFETDAIDWYFDYVTGILSIQDPGSYSTPYKMTIYQYTGKNMDTKIGGAGYATTGSNQFNGDQIITGSVLVTGTLTAKEYHSTILSSSIIYTSGSTKFGDTSDDTMQVTGSLIVTNGISGSIAATNGVVSGSTQIRNLLPVGVVSGSSQVTGIGNAQLTNSTISGVSLGSNLFSLTIGTGLSGTSYNGSSAVTIANTGVTSLAGTTNQVSVSAGTGAITLSLPQSIATTSNVTFANVYATADVVAYYTSDKRHKNNIKIIPNALEKVSKLNGVTWEWNDDVAEFTKLTPTTGLIAQDVQEVLPEVVKEKEDGFLGLDYSRMMGLMVEAIKEQQTQIHSLTLELEKLKKNNSL